MTKSSQNTWYVGISVLILGSEYIVLCSVNKLFHPILTGILNIGKSDTCQCREKEYSRISHNRYLSVKTTMYGFLESIREGLKGVPLACYSPSSLFLLVVPWRVIHWQEESCGMETQIVRVCKIFTRKRKHGQ